MTAFTAEEIWKAMKHVKGEEVESPMLTDYPVVNEVWEDKKLAEKWKKIIEVRDIVAKELEERRAEKVIGNALDAKVMISAGEDFKFLSDNKDLLKDVLMVSGLEIKETSDKEIKAKAEHADGEKCERCWKYETDLTEDHICHRCAEVLGK
jgi:isoleucyl-tRNA synthetase